MDTSRLWGAVCALSFVLISPVTHALNISIDIEKFTSGSDADFPDSPDLPQITPGEPIEWTYVVTNTSPDNVRLEDVQIDDPAAGVAIDCPKSSLARDEHMTCTASANAMQLRLNDPNVVSGTCGGISGQPVHRNIATVTASDDAEVATIVSDSDSSHYCNPPPQPPLCDVEVEKSCELPPPPPVAFEKCSGKLREFSLIWPGDPITIGGLPNDAPGGIVNTHQRVTFTGPFSSNDVKVDIFGVGQSLFHMSCSDPEMNDPGDCGHLEGDGKGKSGFINEWQLAGFIDDDGIVMDCAPPVAAAPTSNCEIGPLEAVSCASTGKPATFTFRYLGKGPVTGCTDNAASRADSKPPVCEGNLVKGAPVDVSVERGTVSPATVAPGEEFTLSGFGSSTVITLYANGGIETDAFHTSCSAPLQAGDVFGNLELVAFDAQRESVNVTYHYTLTNKGGEVFIDKVEDDKLGILAEDLTLAAAGTEPFIMTFTRTVPVSESVTNIVTVDSEECTSGDSFTLAEASATVTVLSPPPCDIQAGAFDLGDYKVKLRLKNHGHKLATVDSIALDAPDGFGSVKKIKLAGDIYKGDTGSTFITFSDADFIGEVKNRQIKAGDSIELLIEFTRKYKEADVSEVNITVNFAEGCTVVFDQ